MDDPEPDQKLRGTGDAHFTHNIRQHGHFFDIYIYI